MAENELKDQNILLVKKDGSDRLEAIAGFDSYYNVQTVEATAQNADRFLKFDRNNPKELEDIMVSFKAGFMNDLDYEMFQVRYGSFEKEMEGLEEALALPRGTKESREALIGYKVDPLNPTAARNVEAPKAAREPKVLLTRDKDGKMKAVAGVDENTGRVKTVAATKENAASFQLFDTDGDMFKNFIKRFSEQSEHPTHSGFYAVVKNAVERVAAFFERAESANPEDKVLIPYRVEKDGEMQAAEPGMFTPLDLNRLDWDDMERAGITGDDLTGALRALAWGHKSKLLEIHPDGMESPVKARLSIVETPDGTLRIQAHPRQETPDFKKPFMGVEFTAADIEQFQLTGNGGRVFNLVTPEGEVVPSLVSLDRYTNRFEAIPLSDIQIPTELKGVELTEKQQQGLLAGEGVLVEGMTKKLKQGEEDKGETITRIVQYNATEKGFDFLYTSEQIMQYRQEREARQTVDLPDGSALKTRKIDGIFVRPVQGGVPLSKKDFDALCNGEPVWVEGVQWKSSKPQNGSEQKVEATDKKGQTHNVWVWIDREQGRVRHTSKHPNQVRAYEAKMAAKNVAGAKPAAGSETQVAVNNDGKTNEATKRDQANGKPVKQGQTRSQSAGKSAEKQGQKRSEGWTPPTPRQNRGHRV